MRYLFLLLFFCSCGVTRKEQYRLYEMNKKEYQWEFDNNTITRCDYDYLMNGNFIMFYPKYRRAK